MTNDQESAAKALLGEWARRIATLDPESVSSLYDPEAQFWGTLAGHLRDDPAGVRSYFDTFLDRHAVDPVIGEVRALRLPGAVLLAGDYTFHLADKAGDEPVATRARFTMVCASRDGVWRILQHHSSGWVQDGI